MLKTPKTQVIIPMLTVTKALKAVISESGNAQLEAFLSKFPVDANSWDKATDELPDMLHWLRENGDCELPPASKEQTRRSPSAWNTFYVEAIRSGFAKQSDRTKALFVARFSEWLYEGVSPDSQIPRRFTHGPAIRKPESLPDNAEDIQLSQEEREFLDGLPLFEVDGQDLLEVDLPPDVTFCILVDFTTHLSWLCNTAGYNYPRYVININPYDRKGA